VASWLNDNNWSQYSSEFKESRIDGRTLLSLSADNLTEELSVTIAIARLIVKRFQDLQKSECNLAVSKKLETWTEEDVASWLNDNNWSQYSSEFKESRIDGRTLRSLSAEDLKDELSVTIDIAKLIVKRFQDLQTHEGKITESKKIETWTEEDVASWLNDNNWSQYSSEFKTSSYPLSRTFSKPKLDIEYFR